ncbi:MAG: hypothetical protein ACWGQW_08035 [bacterium]
MAKRHFDDWLKTYMQYSSKSEAPDKFHFWCGISTIAGALRRCVWIDQGYFQWTPCFYIIFVAPPGIVSKSTTASIGMNLLKRVPGINFGPDAATWQALAQAFVHNSELIQKADGDFDPMSAITISSSEFGTFLNPQDREMVDLLVSMWDGQRGVWKKATKTMGDDVVENPWINMIACTTPSWIAGNFPEYMIGGGFTSRCIFVYAEEKRHLVAYPKEILPKDFDAMGDMLIHDLEIIAQLRGEYTLSHDSRVWGEIWYEDLYVNRPEHLTSDRLAGYLARKQTHLHKIAMVVAASQSDELIIHPHHLEVADEVLKEIEADMPKVFARIGQTNLTRASLDIVTFARRYKRVNQQIAYQKFYGTLSFKEFQDALLSAIQAGFLRQHQVGSTIYLEALEVKDEAGNDTSSGEGNRGREIKSLKEDRPAGQDPSGDQDLLQA